MLKKTECYARIKPVDIGPVLGVMHLLEFEDSGGVCAHVTKKGSETPRAMVRLLSKLSLGGTPERVFCRKLLPGQGIAPHVDEWMGAEKSKRLRRFHIPLISHPDIVMRWPVDSVQVHLEPGYLWEVRYDRLHEVVNNTPFDRIHIQIDQLDATI